MARELTKTKLILFDIDGTLVRGIGKHPETFKEAFEEIFDVATDISEFNGPTDLQILYDVLDAHHIVRDQKKIDRFIDRAVEIFKTKDLSTMVVLPGIIPLLDSLKRETHIHIGLVTGNIEDIAYIKLKYIHIDNYFLKGGFGGIINVRSDIVKDAIQKFENDLGHIEKSNIFIIGDAVHDIHAAKISGVKVIAVATNKHTMDELQKENPDYLFKDLSDTQTLLHVIKNG